MFGCSSQARVQNEFERYKHLVGFQMASRKSLMKNEYLLGISSTSRIILTNLAGNVYLTDGRNASLTYSQT